MDENEKLNVDVKFKSSKNNINRIELSRKDAKELITWFESAKPTDIKTIIADSMITIVKDEVAGITAEPKIHFNVNDFGALNN